MKKKLLKTLYYIGNVTWGGILTLIGALVAVVLLCLGKKPKRHHGCVYFVVGRAWGGLELGLFFIVDSSESLHTKNHEFGHSLQNCIMGPFFIPMVSLPSAIRYWLRNLKTDKGKIAYVVILLTVMFLLSVSSILIGSLTALWLAIIGVMLLTYSFIIMFWLVDSELPKYKNGSTVPYDEIWFEGTATEFGSYVGSIW
jgi:hypothetical protein